MNKDKYTWTNENYIEIIIIMNNMIKIINVVIIINKYLKKTSILDLKLLV